MATVECDYSEVEAPDASCVKSNTNMITRLIYGRPGHPIVLKAAVGGTDTLQARFSREVLRRLALVAGDPERLQLITDVKAQWPFPTPATRTDPNTGRSVIVPNDTPIQITGTEYRYNKSLYAFYKKMSESGQAHLWFFGVGNELIVGDIDPDTGQASGIVATLSAIGGIIDGAEISNQIRYTIDYKGDPIPERYVYNF